MKDITQNNHVCNAWSGMKGYCVECGVHYTDEMERRANLIVYLEAKLKAEENRLEEELTYAIEILEVRGVDYDEVRTAYLLEGVIK
jgi:hypothetical protein